MCVFVLLAGAKREVPSEARIMVHQIWLGDRREDAVAANYSAEDLVLVQRDIGRLAMYTVEMGGSIELLEMSLRIPPWEPMRALSRAEMRRANLIPNDDIKIAPRPAVAVVAATDAAAASEPRARGAKVPRGWTLIEASKQPMLTRHHPLTVEGEEIGSFEVTVTCSADPQRYQISYSERRRVRNRATPLRSVALALGSRSEPLKVLSSEPVSEARELSTFARGSISSAMLRRFADTSRRALLVSTWDTDDTRTAIRVGNSGIGPALSKLASRCGSPRNARHADLVRQPRR
jgi:hypothetical protein